MEYCNEKGEITLKKNVLAICTFLLLIEGIPVFFIMVTDSFYFQIYFYGNHIHINSIDWSIIINHWREMTVINNYPYRISYG